MQGLKQIQTDKYFIFTLTSLLSVFFIFLNFYLWHSTLLGVLFFGIYLVINSIWLNKFLSKIIAFDSPYCYLLAAYCLLILIAFAGAIFVVLWKITPAIMIGIFSGLTLIISALNHKVRNYELGIMNYESRAKKFKSAQEERNNLKVNKKFSVPCSMFHVMCYVLCALVLLCFLFLWKARTGNYILSPWQSIHSIYLYFWFFVTFGTAYLIFTKPRERPARLALQREAGGGPWTSCEGRPARGGKWRIILLIIILHSFLLHAYLPIVYKTGFGGDRWRHIAAERYLQQGKIYSPALFGEEIRWQKFGPIKVPSVFVVGNKTSYANQWALTSFLSWIFNIDVFWIDIFLLPILWSVFIPLFLFLLGRLLIRNFIRNFQFPLLLAFLPSLFYPFQVYGSITIPTAFGFLLFLFILLLFLSFISQKRDKLSDKQSKRIYAESDGYRTADQTRIFSAPKWLCVMCYVLCVTLLYFSYALYLILFLEISLIIFVGSRIIANKNKFTNQSRILNVKHQMLCVTYYVLCVLCFLLLIPFLDTAYSLTEWNFELLAQPSLILSSLGEFIQKLLGFDSHLLLPTHITQGNFIYMQTSQSLSSNTLLSLIKWPIIISSIIWGFIIYGLSKQIRRRSKTQIENADPRQICVEDPRKFAGPYSKASAKQLNLMPLLLFFLTITLGNQFISNYFMQGVRILSKRLDLMISFLMIPFLGFGLYKFINTSSRLMTKKAKIILICLFLALASTSTYASGPKLEVVTKDELKAAQYIWQKLQATPASLREAGRASYPGLAPRSGAGKLQAKDYCVLANTWPLLAVEAVSAREIIGGGFPVYQEYAQPERVKLFKGMSMRPSRRYMEKSLEITGASSCYFMTERRFWNKRDSRILEKLENIFGDYKKIGEVYVFYYDANM